MRDLIKLALVKEVSIVNHIYEYLIPDYIYIPITSKPTTKLPKYVYKNTYFDEYISSVSGKIIGTSKVILKQKYYPAIKIKNDYKENIEVKNKKKKIKNIEELITILNANHLDNISNKLNGDVQNIVISSIDEEIYTVKEFMILSNYYNEILDTMEFLKKLYNIDNSLLVTKNTNAKSIKNVRSILGTYPSIKLSLVPDKYLIGYPKFLCEYLNIDYNHTLVLTTSEIYNIYEILKGKIISETFITISGTNLEKSKVIKVKLGTSLKEILDKEFKLIDPEYDLYINGILQGYQVKNIEEVIITKDINMIVINKKINKVEEECTNCGACYKICPVHINVLHCYLNKLSSKNCLSCGLCNYICPSNLKLKEIVKGDKL